MMSVYSKGALVYIRLSLIYGLHTLFGALLLGRVVGETSWNWFLVFIPLFIFDFIAAIYWLIYLVTYIWMRVNDELDDDIGNRAGGGLCIIFYDEHYKPICFPQQSMSLLVVIFYFLAIPAKLAAQILLCFALSGSVQFYIPGILFCLLFLGSGIGMFVTSLKPVLRNCSR